ncbi:dual specificity protein phosphatase family protein [Candidatus Uabimicrobium sp. HlEnr_7]|uniref:phosphatase domain-containing putative toxin n=1 Tax=Candidatus Uabimicrobium helgolandensis TaxID=3095367 RepID=UPI0035584070
MPIGFCWILEKKLAGAGRPGLTHDIMDDYNYYKNLGISFIVNLTERRVSPSPDEYGFREEHFPIRDMSTPKLEETFFLCQRILNAIAEGEIALLHCKAGLGRTGTVLACCLISKGKTAIEALDYIRIRNRGYIQTLEQEDFLVEYELYHKSKSLC